MQGCVNRSRSANILALKRAARMVKGVASSLRVSIAMGRESGAGWTILAISDGELNGLKSSGWTSLASAVDKIMEAEKHKAESNRAL